MPSGSPTLELTIAVPSTAGVPSASYGFALLPGRGAHRVQDQPLGEQGAFEYTLRSWIDGLQTIEQGLEAQGTDQYISSRGVDASFPGQVLVQPVATTIAVASGAEVLGAPVRQVDFVPSGSAVIGSYLVQESRYLHRITAASPAWARVLDVGAGNTVRDLIGANTYLEAAVGPASPVRESADGVTWATLAIYADRFAVLNDQLWRALRPTYLYNTLLVSSPYAWSSSYQVADTGYDINSLTPMEQVLMIGKEDGVYTLDDQGGTTPQTPELRPQANDDFASQRATVTFNGDYYFRTLNGLLRIDLGGVKHRVGLDQVVSPDLPTPVIKALCSDDRFLYAICDNTSNGLLIARRSIRGAWHPWYWDATAGRASHIAFSGVLGYPAIFFSYYDGSAYVTKFIRTSTFPNPLQDTAYRYDTGASFYLRLPRVGGPNKTTIDRVVIQSQNLAAGITIAVEVSIDGAARQAFGSAATTSPFATVTPTTPITGTTFDFYCLLTTNSATTSPVLRAFTAFGIKRPGRRHLHSFAVAVDRAFPTRRGGSVNKSPNTLLDSLETLRGTDVYVNVTDENGREFQALVIDLDRSSMETKDPSTQPSHAVTVVLAEKAA